MSKVTRSINESQKEEDMFKDLRKQIASIEKSPHQKGTQPIQRPKGYPSSTNEAEQQQTAGEVVRFYAFTCHDLV